MEIQDYLVLLAYFVLTFVVGIFAIRRQSKTTEDYFLSGRKLPWYLAGLSMVATTFAADTPLAVTGITLERGIAGNFLWLSLIPAGVITTLFYARLWRRSGAATDAEFATLRYSGRPAEFLRRFRALYLAIPVNLIIMGWVTTGMAKVMHVFFGYPTWLTLGALYAFTVIYIIISGLWGVIITDALQFFIAMAGCIILAMVSVDKVGGLDALWQKATLTLKPGFTEIYPWSFSGSVITVAVWLGVQWWASWYPGFEPGGGGYVVQRILSTKNENHAVGASLLFNILHFVVRPWPWIITALCAAVALPHGVDKEALYPQAILAWLPAGLKGLLIAAFLAAFMSTIATHLNWGASYIMQDVLQRTRLARRSEHELVALSRITIVIMAIAAIAVSFLMTSVSQGWELILMLSAGTGPVFLLRWYWMRINAWSEISAMCGSFIASLVLAQFEMMQEVRLCLVASITTAFWVLVTFITPRESIEKISEFRRLVRPVRWKLAELLVLVSAVILIYSAFFLIGELLKGNYYAAGINFLIGCAGGIATFIIMRLPAAKLSTN